MCEDSIGMPRWGQRLGQKKAKPQNSNLLKVKVLEIRRFRGLLASHFNSDILDIGI